MPRPGRTLDRRPGVHVRLTSSTRNDRAVLLALAEQGAPALVFLDLNLPDVDGLDAQSKLALLSALAFGERITPSDIFTEYVRHIGEYADLPFDDIRKRFMKIYVEDNPKGREFAINSAKSEPV